MIIKKIKLIKNLILERLESIQTTVQAIDTSTNAAVENQVSLLQAAVHLVETNQQLSPQLNRKTEILEQQIKLLEHQLKAQAQTLNQLEINQKNIHQGVDLLTKTNQIITIGTDQYPLLNPELGLMSFLYSYLPSRKALDIGANIGEVSSYLLNSGYEVFAFEPFPPVFEQLSQRFSNSAFHAYNFALGSDDGTRTMHIATDTSSSGEYGDASLYGSLVPHSMPRDLKFTAQIDVKVRSLESLHDSAEIPADIGLVKIDTEGNDLDVIQGMGEHRYPVVMSEFWDAKVVFANSGANNSLPDMVKTMTQRGYYWYLVLYRVWGENNSVSFYCNHPQSLESTWGNVFFFQQHEIFAHARDWCAAILPPTYFKDARY
jgi:FkbM family methyltransferase